MIKKKGKQLRIRITEDQLNRLMDTLIIEEINSRSEFVRTAIDEKLKKTTINEGKKKK